MRPIWYTFEPHLTEAPRLRRCESLDPHGERHYLRLLYGILVSGPILLGSRGNNRAGDVAAEKP